MSGILVALSGGMDSATVLGEAIFSSSKNVRTVGFSYGSKHNPYENEAARSLADYYEVPFDLIDISGAMRDFRSDLLKSGGEIPEGHYEDASMSRTVVPGRNLIFASILAGYAWSFELDQVWLGIHAGDHFIYEDCRPVFYAAMNAAILAGTGERVELVAPFLRGNKTSIIARGTELGVPYHLTRTCYKDQELSCGKCGSCRERLEAFQANNRIDPIAYEADIY